ncbi:hypothetical protein ACF09Z_18255 [Streptomyces erythrochromogenes]|uniref:hypothetical protein n=1 Tax=Streptomyces erythrochromogenes TaxID=285574 RepID=UPI0036F76C88
MRSRDVRRMLGAALLLWMTVGCTPTAKAILAVEPASGGGVRVLIAPCPGYDVQQFSAITAGGAGGLQRWAVSNDAMAGPLADMELFVVPPGWSADESTLQGLQDGEEHVLTVVGAVRGRGLDGKVRFRPDRVAALKPGQVLVSDDGETKAISRSQFMKADSARCEP